MLCLCLVSSRLKGRVTYHTHKHFSFSLSLLRKCQTAMWLISAWACQLINILNMLVFNATEGCSRLLDKTKCASCLLCLSFLPPEGNSGLFLPTSSANLWRVCFHICVSLNVCVTCSCGKVILLEILCLCNGHYTLKKKCFSCEFSLGQHISVLLFTPYRTAWYCKLFLNSFIYFFVCHNKAFKCTLRKQ